MRTILITTVSNGYSFTGLIANITLDRPVIHVWIARSRAEVNENTETVNESSNADVV